MSKSFKLKNNIYLDGKSVYLKRYYGNFNNDYVYSSDLSYKCLRLGSYVFLIIDTIAFTQNITQTYTVFATGFPKAKSNTIFYLDYGTIETTQLYDRARVAITQDGNLQTHWGNINHYGNSADVQYHGFVIYETSE